MNAFIKFKQDLLKFGLEWFGLYYGVYAGVVVTSDDPENRGRVKLRCPEVWGAKQELDYWVLPRGNFAGKKIGFHAQPQKDDVVWVTFRGGRPRPEYALWEYGWWTKDNAIEVAAKDVYVLATPKGHVWVIDEANNTMYFTFKGGKTIEIKGNNISLGTPGGSAEPAVLGNKNEAVHNELAAKIDAIFTAISGAAVTPADGGLAFKTAIVTALTAQQFPIAASITQKALDTKSKVVSLD